SDHGHRARGGHGGVEPEVLGAVFVAAGAGLEHGRRLPPARMRDLASTLALLGALPVPRDNLGAPMLDALALPGAERARRLAPVWRQRARADAALDPAVPPDEGGLGAALARGE